MTRDDRLPGPAEERRRDPSQRESVQEALADAPLGPILQSQSPEKSQTGLLRSGAVVMVFAAAANGLNVVFHLSVARFLEPAEYALLTAIFAITVIATVPLLAIQTTVAREMALLLGRREEEAAGAVLLTTFSVVFRFTAAVLLALALLAWPVIQVLNVERPLPIIATALAILSAATLPAAFGALQASERFATLSLVQGLGPLLKLILGVSLAAFGLGASAITFGVVAGNIIVFSIAWRVLRPAMRLAGERRFPKRKVVGRYAAGSAACLGLYIVLTQSDVIWARGTLASADAGSYAAAAVIGTFLLLLPVGVTTVMFPLVAKLGGGAAGRRPLILGLLAVSVLGIPFVVAYGVIPDFLVKLAFGSRYLGASSLLLPLGVAMIGYALLTVYMNHFLAEGKTGFFRVLLVGVVVQQALFLKFHGSPEAITHVQIAVGLTMAVAAEGYERVARRPVPSDADHPTRSSA